MTPKYLLLPLILAPLAACSPSAPQPNAADHSDMAGMSASVAVKTASGTGLITAIDPDAGKVTLKHEAMPDIDWPAMTMSFTARPASLLEGRTVGERVRFEVALRKGGADVTALAPETAPD